MSHNFDSDDAFLQHCIGRTATGVGLDCVDSQSLFDLCESFRRRLETARTKLAEIAVTEGEDSGVIWLSTESPTYFDAELGVHVYEHEHFSQLGDALVELARILEGSETDGSESAS